MLRELVQSWIVICISRSAVDLGMIDPSFRERVVPIRVDIKEKGLHQVVDMVEQILRSKSIKLSGLVNNAYYLEVDSYDDVSAEACELAIQGLFAFHVNLSLEIMSRGLFADQSSIINVSSMYAKVAPNPSIYPQNISVNPLLYGSMKAALIQSTRYLSAIMASKGIRVNSVSYGPFPNSEVQKSSPEFISQLSKNTHIGRIGTPEESAGVIDFLLSSGSTYITGADIAVDGGWTSW